MSELTLERLAELRRICTASLENPCNENLAIFDSAFTDERCLMLVDEIERLRQDLAYVKENAEFLRSSVGECHLMISRNSSEFQTQGKQWRLSDLPARLQRIMRERETLAEALRELVTLKDHLKHADPAEYERRKPAAWEMARTALALLDGEKRR